jgi:hypothetical protein
MNSIIRHLSSRSIGAQKNGVRRVREGLPQRLRKGGTPRLRRCRLDKAATIAQLRRGRTSRFSRLASNACRWTNWRPNDSGTTQGPPEPPKLGLNPYPHPGAIVPPHAR